MTGITFPSTDKARRSTQELEISSKTTLNTTTEIIDFFYNSGHNTFFVNDVDIAGLQRTTKKFRQNSSMNPIDNMDDYIVQNDLSDTGGSIIGLDIDRHELVSGKETMVNKEEALQRISRHFGTVVYAQSFTDNDVFKGRMFFVLNERVDKELFRIYLELWLNEEYNSGYIINHHTWNAGYFIGENPIGSTHISHEFVDMSSFKVMQKLNIYDRETIQIYKDGHRVWTPGSMDPGLVVDKTNVSHRLKKYGARRDFEVSNTYKRNYFLPIRDLLSPWTQNDTINKALIQKRGVVLLMSDITEDHLNTMNTSQILNKAARLVVDGEYPANGLLRRVDGTIKTAEEWTKVYNGTSRANFAYEPNHREETGYLYVRAGKIFDFQGGNTSLISLVYRDKFEPQIIEYGSRYLPESYKDEVDDIDFNQAVPGSGKSASLGYRPDTIFICPKRALAEDLGNQDGFQLIASTTRKDEKHKEGTIYRMSDIPIGSQDTIVMTYDKFAYLDSALGFDDYNLVVDEAPLIFSGYSKYTEKREILIQKIFDWGFKHTRLISADPGFWKFFEGYIKDFNKVSVRVWEDGHAKAQFVITDGVSEEQLEVLKRQRTLVYCNDKTRAREWALNLNAVVISSENRQMDQIDIHPSKNFVFTSVMREGYSFHSKVDNMILDTKARTVVGVNSVIQAANRSRTGATNTIIIHNLKESFDWMTKPSYHDIKRWSDILDIFYSEEAYVRDIWPVINNLDYYVDMKKAIIKESQRKYESVIVSTCIENIEKYQNRYVDWLQQGLLDLGYKSTTQRCTKIVNLNGKSDKEYLRPLLLKGPKAYGALREIKNHYSVGSLINLVWGLMVEEHQKKTKKPNLVSALMYLRRIDIRFNISLISDGFVDYDSERQSARKTKKLNGKKVYHGPVEIFIEDIEEEFRIALLQGYEVEYREQDIDEIFANE